MRTLHLRLLAGLTASLALAASVVAQQRLEPTQSDIFFTSRQMGVPVDGKFTRFDAQVAFDPKKPEAAKIGLTVELGSATLGSPETEAELVKPEWFNTAKFPKAVFQSRSVKPLGAGKFEVAGQLTIKGQARNVVVPVTLAQSGASTTATGSFTLKRLEFKIGDGDWADPSLVANDVQVRFKLALTGVPAL